MSRRRQQLIDELLLVEAQAGSSAALDSLVRRWQGRLWRHARRLLGQEDAAWDACQEAWTGIIKNMRRLDDPSAFGPWAYRIVTNKCADRLRRNSRDRGLLEGLTASRQAADNQDGQHLELRQALGSLTGPMQVVLTLRYIEGFALKEIAEILGLAEGTIKSRLHRARTELRKLLEKRP